MRMVDQALADAVLEPTFVFMRAQTDRARLNMNGFSQYFEYREKDVGKGSVYSQLLFFPFLPFSSLPLPRRCPSKETKLNRNPGT